MTTASMRKTMESATAALAMIHTVSRDVTRINFVEGVQLGEGAVPYFGFSSQSSKRVAPSLRATQKRFEFWGEGVERLAGSVNGCSL